MLIPFGLCTVTLSKVSTTEENLSLNYSVIISLSLIKQIKQLCNCNEGGEGHVFNLSVLIYKQRNKLYKYHKHESY